MKFLPRWADPEYTIHSLNLGDVEKRKNVVRLLRKFRKWGLISFDTYDEWADVLLS